MCCCIERLNIGATTWMCTTHYTHQHGGNGSTSTSASATVYFIHFDKCVALTIQWGIFLTWMHQLVHPMHPMLLATPCLNWLCLLSFLDWIHGLVLFLVLGCVVLQQPKLVPFQQRWVLCGATVVSFWAVVVAKKSWQLFGLARDHLVQVW